MFDVLSIFTVDRRSFILLQLKLLKAFRKFNLISIYLAFSSIYYLSIYLGDIQFALRRIMCLFSFSSGAEVKAFWSSPSAHRGKQAFPLSPALSWRLILSPRCCFVHIISRLSRLSSHGNKACIFSVCHVTTVDQRVSPQVKFLYLPM